LRLPDARALSRRALRRTTRELARHSRGAHLSNILSFLNYRLSYYFLAALAGPKAVGVLSVGVALAEALWLVGRSAAQTQYVDLVNAPDPTARLPHFLRATRLTGIITLAGLLALRALPAPLLALVFGQDFAGARPIIAGLAPGVFALSVGMLLSTWFVGLGHYAPSNRATGAGLLMTLVACAVLVPRFGAVGAALATSLSHVTSTLALLWQFRRATGQGIGALLPRTSDLRPA
jgi:O-antigen/teichoic acid export membrane protein